MSYDKNDWGFDEPDWLEELMADAKADPPPRADTPKTESPRADLSGFDDDWWHETPAETPAKAPRAEAPKKAPAPRSAGPRMPAAQKTAAKKPARDWEQARTQKTSSRPARSSTGEPAYRQSGKKRHRKINTPVLILIVLLVAGMAFAAWQLGSIFLGYSRDRSAYNDLAAAALSELAERDDTSRQPEDSDTLSDATATPVESEIPFSVDWEYLRSINSDIVGWLYCPDTVINYPVVQSQDHDYYLNHGFDKASNTTGTLFADRASVSGITQSNFIIYGHNMKDESMFGTFKYYVDASYYNQHPILYYMTPNGSYRIELISAHITEATADNFPTYFSSTSAQQEYLNRITSSAYWVNYDAVTTDYQIITMSTCTSGSGYSDPRFLVHGIMIPIQ